MAAINIYEMKKKSYSSRLQEIVSFISSANPTVQAISPEERHCYWEYIVLQ